jgi:hypothetical protein
MSAFWQVLNTEDIANDTNMCKMQCCKLQHKSDTSLKGIQREMTASTGGEIWKSTCAREEAGACFILRKTEGMRGNGC